MVFVFVQLARQVCGIPKEYAIKILTPDCSDGRDNFRSSTMIVVGALLWSCAYSGL
jgi:hypothetical protein